MIGSVVVLYNPTEDEIKNINTYLNDIDYGVIIDNSSADNKEWIFSIINDVDKIRYYSERKNLGLCKGFNIGIQFLKKKGCEWALLFDADSKLGNNIVSIYKKAIKKFNENDIALFCPVHVFDRSKAQPYAGYKEVTWSMTSGWLVNIDIFCKLGGFFEELFVDGLDMDYCFKLHENGYKVIECGEVFINHNPASTKRIGKLKYGIASPNRYYMQARQLVWCGLRYKKLNPILIYLYKWIKVFFLFPSKDKYFNQMTKGTKEGIRLYRRYKKLWK